MIELITIVSFLALVIMHPNGIASVVVLLLMPLGNSSIQAILILILMYLLGNPYLKRTKYI